MTSTEYRWEEFTAGKIVVWILFVVLALGVAGVTAWYGRERFQGPSDASGNSSEATKPSIAVVKIEAGFPLRSSPRSVPNDNQVMLLPKGETLTVVGSLEGRPWYNVRLSDGTEGWIHGNGIELR